MAAAAFFSGLFSAINKILHVKWRTEREWGGCGRRRKRRKWRRQHIVCFGRELRLIKLTVTVTVTASVTPAVTVNRETKQHGGVGGWHVCAGSSRNKCLFICRGATEIAMRVRRVAETVSEYKMAPITVHGVLRSLSPALPPPSIRHITPTQM